MHTRRPADLARSAVHSGVGVAPGSAVHSGVGSALRSAVRSAPRSAVRAAALVLLLVAGACAPSVGEYDAVLRGDRAFAAGAMEEALAEYRLAVLQGNEEPEVYGRLGHTYARLARVDEAADSYASAAEGDSLWADQAVADLVGLARQAAERNDLFSVASAMQRALEFRPGLSVGELALPLARHYARSGEPGRALPFFQRAMAAVPSDSVPDIMYETAIAFEDVGDCGRAIVFFEQYRETLPRWQRDEVDWHLSNCSFRYAQTLYDEGRLESAVQHLDQTIAIGEPRSVLARAWFQKADILSLLGACGEALEAYRQVPSADLASSSLVNRARNRIDQIRFGGFDESFDLDARCGLPQPRFERGPRPVSPPESGSTALLPDSVGGDSLRMLPDSMRMSPGAEGDSLGGRAVPPDTLRGLRSTRVIEL